MNCAHRGNAGLQSGFTLIEVLVALVIFGMGASAVWYGFTGISRIHARTAQNRIALQLAQAELESIRIRPKIGLQDSMFQVERNGAIFKVERIVFDSLKILDSLESVDLDENASPIYLRRPREIMVRVLVGRFSGDSRLDGDFEESKPVVTLHLLKPEYQWH